MRFAHSTHRLTGRAGFDTSAHLIIIRLIRVRFSGSDSRAVIADWRSAPLNDPVPLNAWKHIIITRRIGFHVAQLRPDRWSSWQKTKQIAYTMQSWSFEHFCWFLVRDAFVRTNRRAIATVFVRPPVCLSVWDGPASWSYATRFQHWFKFMDR